MNQQFPFEHFINTNNIPQVDTNKEKAFNSPSRSTHEKNNLVINHFKNAIGDEKFSTYFDKNLNIANIEGDRIILTAKNDFVRSIFNDFYKEDFEEAFFRVYNMPLKAEINCPEISSLKNETEHSPKSKPATVKNAKDATFTIDLDQSEDELASKAESQYINYMKNENEVSIDPNKTFDCFIIGPSNNLACAAAKAVAQNPGKSGKYPSLYIYSNSGLGKTHLLHAVANDIKELHPQLVICLITARDFMTEMINSIQNNNISLFRKKYSEKIDVLMIDDIHELKDKQGTQNEFFHIFNELHNKGKQLIFTSDKSPKEIIGIAERIKTRLQWGLVIDIQKPDLETRIAILKKKAYELDLYIQDDVINLIASSIKASIRELEGALIKLSAFIDVMNVEIDSQMVKDLLNLNEDENYKVITIDSIAKATSQYFKIPVADLKSKARNKNITIARHIAMYLSRKVINATQQEIGTFFGGRDHSSVIHAVRTITQKIKTDSALSKDVILIENNL